MAPTLYPTSICCELFVGRACEFSHAVDLDLMIILDTSSENLNEESYDLVIDSLATSISEVFPNFNSHFGFTLFSTNNEIRINLEHFKNSNDFANLVRKEKRLPGAGRNMNSVLKSVFDNSWTVDGKLDLGNLYTIF